VAQWLKCLLQRHGNALGSSVRAVTEELFVDSGIERQNGEASWVLDEVFFFGLSESRCRSSCCSPCSGA